MVYIADETKRKFTSTIHSLKLQVTDKSSATDASRRVCMSVSYNHVTHFKYHLDPFSLLYECYLCSHHITEHRMRTLSYRVLALYICGPNNQLQLSLVVFHFVKLMGQLDDVVLQKVLTRSALLRASSQQLTPFLDIFTAGSSFPLALRVTVFPCRRISQTCLEKGIGSFEI